MLMLLEFLGVCLEWVGWRKRDMGGRWEEDGLAGSWLLI